MSDIKPCVLAGNKPAIIAIAVGIFVAGIGIGYVLFTSMYNPYTMMTNPAAFNQMMGSNQQFSNQYMGYMMQNPQFMSQWMSQNPQYMGQWMGYMLQNPAIRQQMYGYMFQNKDFMYGIMGNQTFQNQYMGPWMMQNPNFQQQLTPQGNQPNNLGSGMMGGSGMGPGMMSGYTSGGSSYKSVSIKDATGEINSLPSSAQVSKDSDTITFASTSVDLTSFSMIGSDAINMTGYNPPSSAHSGGDVFVVGGLINPTLVVKSGTQLSVTLINLDEDMSHNFVITESAPPYYTTPMMGNGGFLNTMPILPNEEKQQGYAYEYTDSVTLNQPGTYWYICTYPGHAEEGMYGKIVVQ
ncbi:MAG: plastocyanin/azurin family copper-binding protein [Nitrosotalea sp.]